MILPGSSGRIYRKACESNLEIFRRTVRTHLNKKVLMKPTSLTPTVFWSNPDLVASLLNLEMSGTYDKSFTYIKGPIKIIPVQ